MKKYAKKLELIQFGLEILNIKYYFFGSYVMFEKGLIKRPPSDIDIALTKEKNRDIESLFIQILERMGFDENDYYYKHLYPHLGAKDQILLKVEDSEIPINVCFVETYEDQTDEILINWKKEALERRAHLNDVLDVYYIEYKKIVSIKVAEKIVTYSRKMNIPIIDAIHQYELHHDLPEPS